MSSSSDSEYQNYYTDEEIARFMSVQHLDIWSQGYGDLYVLTTGCKPLNPEKLNFDYLRRILDCLSVGDKLRLRQCDYFLMNHISKLGHVRDS